MGKNKKSKSKSYVINGKGYTLLPPCHIGFTEVHEGLFVGKATSVSSVLDKVDILVPLNDVDGEIWESGWNGEIFYVPIKDFSTLPKHIEEQKVQYVYNKMLEGKKVAVFCTVGHGRTGYFASLIMGKFGIQDPIEILRSKYCENTVETSVQVQAIADFIDNQELVSKYPCKFNEFLDYSLYGNGYGYGFGYDDYKEKSAEATLKQECKGYCGECGHYEDRYGAKNWGYCTQHQKTINWWEYPCGDME